MKKRMNIILFASFSLILIIFVGFASAQATGRILKVSEIRNFDGIANDKVGLIDRETGDQFDVLIISEGRGTVDIDGISYFIFYFDDRNVDGDENIEFSTPQGNAQRVFKHSYVLIGKPAWSGRILRVSRVVNFNSPIISNDIVQFIDINSGETLEAIIISDGIASLTVDGTVYNVKYYDDRNVEGDEIIEISGLNPDVITFPGILGGMQRVFKGSYIIFNGGVTQAKTIKVIRGDVNGDEIIDISDVVYLLNYLFKGERAPPEPFPNAAICTIEG